MALCSAPNQRNSERFPFRKSSRSRGESPTFADLEPRRGPFGPSGVLGPRPPRAEFFGPRAGFGQRA
eukprot:11234980-Alexandrium_andersonii.AAC.1